MTEPPETDKKPAPSKLHGVRIPSTEGEDAGHSGAAAVDRSDAAPGEGGGPAAKPRANPVETEGAAPGTAGGGASAPHKPPAEPGPSAPAVDAPSRGGAAEGVPTGAEAP